MACPYRVRNNYSSLFFATTMKNGKRKNGKRMKGGCLSECIGIKGEGAVEVEATKKEVPGNKEQKWANSRSVEIKRR